MRNSEIAQILRDDQWSITHGETDAGPYILRFRRELISVRDTTGYSRLLTILWPYADEGSSALPSPDDTAAMAEFESRLHKAFEHDGHAVVAAILTFDGARQWTVYSDDIGACGERIASMPQAEDPYPIEMHARDDAQWEYLRQEVLHGVR